MPPRSPEEEEETSKGFDLEDDQETEDDNEQLKPGELDEEE